ncbi:prolyl oligopeptidase family serine peptidase [Planotetraspora phitsanulokensis]|uniref:Acyl-peptide hydrolase n=1 Tax=Planotetraspora phitsanulokensis TaxID=575192 RepID=A0A8J3UFE5_9ACTN|nr:prolyl oligopeptidase family serine peptidase [Planotetraspora phitsanulokensis]GII42286.1 acyl-peptide hydrolase [Planotetraspora phitsanulokensis]
MSIHASDVARTDDHPLWVEISGDEAWWDESRPHEGGRRCVVRRTASGTVEDVLPQGWNARNRVIEYGGRSWRAHRGRLIFTNWDDGRIYVCAPGEEPVPITPEGPARYGDLVVHASGHANGDGRGEAPGDALDGEVLCVREIGVGRDVTRDIVAVPLDGVSPMRSLIKSHHFLMNPRILPDGQHIAWIGWNHPDMPWDATELCVAPVEGGPYRILMGGENGRVSVVQAEWRDAGSLYAVADPTGWWNIHLVGLDGASRDLTPMDQEFGDASWRIGNTFFALAGHRIVAMHGTGDERRLGVIDDPEAGTPIRDVGGSYTFWTPTLSADGRHVVGVGASPYRPHEVVRIDVETGEPTVLSTGKRLPPAELLPTPEPVTIEGVHVHLYAPHGSAARENGAGGPAPYVVFVHGGPTSSAAPVLDLTVAYFTSRGIGVAEVNYGGSSGYGRAYRERLRHNWGVVDVRDSETVARWLISSGRAAKVAIRGGSAGGWTSLAALVHSDVFCGAVSHYGISDPEGWAAETHDFESRYLDGLIGPLPETRARYSDRSPVLHAARASGPALLMHGLEDAVVDPSQSERFAEALARHGGRWAYRTFPGEQHGWRREETIVAVLETELAFYGLIFGFPTPEVPPLTLEGALDGNAGRTEEKT